MTKTSYLPRLISGLGCFGSLTRSSDVSLGTMTVGAGTGWAVHTDSVLGPSLTKRLHLTAVLAPTLVAADHKARSRISVSLPFVILLE